ncbi:maltodextrin glucosidase [Salmonella enterica subsp. salamae]|nr:maltodextrin glucosidase [Salmonella enterica subsp. salamae]
MLNAWHLPVAPFVKQHNDKLTITLWLSGENPPSRVTLRSEFDNEEISLAMRKQRRQPQPGVTAWRATLNIALGQPRRRYSFKLLWHDPSDGLRRRDLAVFRLRVWNNLRLMRRTVAHSGSPIKFFIRSSRIVLPAARRVKQIRTECITIMPRVRRLCCATGTIL